MSGTIENHIRKILLSGARGNAVLVSVGTEFEELSGDELPITTILIPEVTQLRSVAGELLKRVVQKFEVVLGIYDASGEVTPEDICQLNEIFQVVIFGQKHDADFLAQFYQELYANSREKVAGMSKAARGLFSSTYALRVENERLRTAVYETSRALDQAPKLVTTTTVTAPGPSPLELFPEHSSETIRQRVFKPSRGFCGFDLHFPYPPPKQKADLFINLRSGDNNDVLAEWVVDPSAVFGWVHCPLGSPLLEGVTSLIIELRAFPWGHPDAAPDAPGRISTGANPLSYETDLTVNDVPQHGLSLALRVWVGPPGKLLPYVTPFAARHVPYDASAPGYFIPLLVSEKNVGALTNVELSAVASKEITFSIPRMQDSGEIFLPGVIPARVERAFANVEAPSTTGLLVQAEAVDSRVKSPPGSAGEHEPTFVRAFFVGPGSVAPLDVSIPDPDRQFDLRLQFKVLDPKADALEFKLNEFRATWAPSCARPLRLDRSAVETLLDKEHLSLIRERRHFRAQGVEAPTVELLCPIHRLEDASRLKANLDRLLTGACTAVIISHGDANFSRSIVETVGSSARKRHISITKSHNLGYCLNRAIESSTADYVIKIDADDIYFEHFATDLVMWSVSSGASVVGKAQFPLLFEDDDELCYFSISRDHGFVEQVAGGTICLRREIHVQVPFNEVLPRGTDKVFLLDAQAAGARLFSGDGLNYVHTRGRDIRRHTWNGSNEEFRSADYRLVGTASDMEMFRA